MGLVDPNELGSHFDVQESVVIVSPAYAQALPADPQRVAVLWGVGVAGVAAVVTTNPAALTNDGITVPTSGYLEFCFSRHGPLPAQAWYAKSSGGGGRLTVITVSLRRP